LIATVRKAPRLQGDIRVPGDKSISHRALILGSIADGESHFRGLSTGADVMSTAACMRALGVQITDSSVRGVGMGGLRHPSGPLDCGNSGTTMRLLAGLLAAQRFSTELRGDESLSKRPMDRVVTPLREMGADARWPPLIVGGQVPLHGIEYVMPVASAQVKSALLIAGLYATGTTTVIEPVVTRDHTELMLQAMWAQAEGDYTKFQVHGIHRLEPLDIDIPGDLSAASFWLVAGALIPGSQIRVLGVGANSTRTAIIEVMRSAGLEVSVSNSRNVAREKVADFSLFPAKETTAIQVKGEMAAGAIDELPILAVAATQLPGVSRITGARELRVKESDRIAAMAEGLSAMGANITALDDGWEIRGPRRLEGAHVRSHKDHRIAMALAIAGLLADGVTEIEEAECVDISYPGFFDQMESLC
jgi:3-phosphoshikimate 1-carboxyvinyltransferase